MVRSVLEANPNSVQIERDQADLDTLPGNQAGRKGSGIAPVEDQIEGTEYIQSPTTQDSIPNYGAPKTLPPIKSKSTHRGLAHLLLGGLCRIGIHHGDWEYLFEGECSQSRECGQCRTIHARTKHRRQWGYIQNESCNQRRSCMRCQSVDKQRVRHEAWSEAWDVGRDEKAHRCLRCKVIEKWSTACND